MYHSFLCICNPNYPIWVSTLTLLQLEKKRNPVQLFTLRITVSCVIAILILYRLKLLNWTVRWSVRLSYFQPVKHVTSVI